MAGKTYIIRGDDGTLYRVSHEQLAAYRLGPDDPAAQHAGKLAEAGEAVKQSVGKFHPAFVCLAAMVDQSGSSSGRSVSGGDD